MASNIPIRRSTRSTVKLSSTTSTAAAPENTHALRPRRGALKQSQPTASKVASKPVLATKSVAGPSAVAATKKRPGLVDVTKQLGNKEKSKKPVGKDKPSDTKPSTTIVHTKSTVATRRTTRSTAKAQGDVPTKRKVSEKVETVVSMEVDAPVVPPFTRVIATDTTSSSNRPLATVQETAPRVSKRPSNADELDQPAAKKRYTDNKRQPQVSAQPEELYVDSKQGQEEELRKRMLEMEAESQLEAEQVQEALAKLSPAEELLEVEHDPNGALWEDIDAEDDDDPAMVSEYVVETFQWMRETEGETVPMSNYMIMQSEVDWRTRAVLVDWLIQIHAHCRLLPETLFLTINILDRFLAKRAVSLTRLQLVGVVSLLIAAKFEETYAPSVPEIALLADNVYDTDAILKAERFVLKTLEWNLSGFHNTMGWLRRCSKADDSEVRARTVGKYLCEIACVEYRLVSIKPSLVAAAALWFARLVLGREDWTPNLAHYSGYRESEIIPTANMMLNYLLQPIRHPNLHKKYASKRFMKTSIYMRQWALERWGMDSKVDLAASLSGLKVDIRKDRAIAASEEMEREMAAREEEEV